MSKCLGCRGTGKVTKMPETETKNCQLCGGFGFE